MTDLFLPGDERAGAVMSSEALLRAMVRVEDVWLARLVDAGVAPAAARIDLVGSVGDVDVGLVARGAEAGGNPVIPLVAGLRGWVEDAHPESARWLHRGLTSQDVLDTALVLCLREALTDVAREQSEQVRVLSGLAQEHRSTVMAGRTLSQHAVPITFGLKASGWLGGILDAAASVRDVLGALPVQCGGAAGTLAATVELARASGADDPVATARALADGLAVDLGLRPSAPWHTSRRPVTRAADALVASTDAYGRLASDVVTLGRPEIGELGEPAVAGRGGSSTMPHKQNPVLSVLVRRAAITAPGLAATLHTAAALADDERPDGAWHAEWPTLRTLARTAVVAAGQTTELLAGLVVHVDRMAGTVAAARDPLLAERASMVGRDDAGGPHDYLGAADRLVDEAVGRADAFLGTAAVTA